MISFENVTKTYPDGTTAVDSLNLDIEEGSFTVFVGPSGCGKTTSMRMINKMIAPTSGRIMVGSRDVAEIPAVSHRLGIGYVIQHAGLLPHRTVLDNVAQVLRLKGVPRKQARAKAHEAIERVRLNSDLVHRYPAQLSGGQQQRVGVARALAADPPILLMDEPFSAVDPVVREELQQEMLRIQDDLHKTIAFVTHDIDEALRLGDKIAVFAPGGQMQQYAEAKTVLSHPANELVASMIGRDRGFRALSFHTANDLTIQRLPEADAERGYHFGEWRLITNENSAPKQWEDGSGRRIVVGSVARADSSLRSYLDAVLSSPNKLGPIVDEHGCLIGVIAAEDVYRALDSREWAHA